MAALAFADEFCDGYAKGFRDGWCQDEGIVCQEPMDLIACPPTPRGRDTITDGYHDGLLAGKAAKDTKKRGN